MIKKIVIEIHEKEIELTLAQAKKLFKDLEQIFDTPVKVIERYIASYPVYQVAPQTTLPWRPAPPIWCGPTADKIERFLTIAGATSSNNSQS